MIHYRFIQRILKLTYDIINKQTETIEIDINMIITIIVEFDNGDGCGIL